jgi:hypothetical protein
MQGHEIEIILVALLAVSEALSLIPAVKSNSVFQLIYNGIKKVKEYLPKIKEAIVKVKELIKEIKEKK